MNAASRVSLSRRAASARRCAVMSRPTAWKPWSLPSSPKSAVSVHSSTRAEPSGWRVRSSIVKVGRSGVAAARAAKNRSRSAGSTAA